MPWWPRRSDMDMEKLADRGRTLNPVSLLYNIKSAMATYYQNQMAPPALTVGESNTKSGTPRAALWLVAVFLPTLYIGSSAVAVHFLYTHPHLLSAGYPWCLPAMVLWGVYMALVPVVLVYMSLSLPKAPVAVREALVNVGWGWVGMPVLVIDSHLVFYGQTWMLIAMVCLLGLLIAALLAFWVWLVRTYSK